MCTSMTMKQLFNEDIDNPIPFGCVICNSTEGMHMIEVSECNYAVLCGNHTQHDFNTHVDAPLMDVKELLA